MSFRPGHDTPRQEGSTEEILSSKATKILSTLPSIKPWTTLSRGSAGRPITVRSNNWTLEIPLEKKLFALYIAFKPPVRSAQSRYQIFHTAIKADPNYANSIAFDGTSNGYVFTTSNTSKDLFPKRFTVLPPYLEKADRGDLSESVFQTKNSIEVSITLETEIPLSTISDYVNQKIEHPPQEILQAINAIVRDANSRVVNPHVPMMGGLIKQKVKDQLTMKKMKEEDVDMEELTHYLQDTKELTRPTAVPTTELAKNPSPKTQKELNTALIRTMLQNTKDRLFRQFLTSGSDINSLYKIVSPYLFRTTSPCIYVEQASVATTGVYHTSRYTRHGINIVTDVHNMILRLPINSVKFIELLESEGLYTIDKRNPYRWNMLFRYFKNVRVRTNYRSRLEYRITGIANVNALQKEMTIEKNTKFERKVTLAQFFKDKYDITLKYPELPLLLSGYHVFLPPELCDIVECQPLSGNLSAVALKMFLKYTRHDPKKREEFIQQSCLSMQQSSILRESEIKISKDLLKISARILSPPVVFTGIQQLNSSKTTETDKSKSTTLVPTDITDTINSSEIGSEEQLHQVKKLRKRAILQNLFTMIQFPSTSTLPELPQSIRDVNAKYYQTKRKLKQIESEKKNNLPPHLQMPQTKKRQIDDVDSKDVDSKATEFTTTPTLATSTALSTTLVDPRIRPLLGSFSFSANSRKLLQPVVIKHPVLIVTTSTETAESKQMITTFFKKFFEQANQMGLLINELQEIVWLSTATQIVAYLSKFSIKNNGSENKNKSISRPDCIFSVVPQDNVNMLYSTIKRSCDLDLGIISQCINSHTIFHALKKNLPILYENLVLKINYKSGGVNYQCQPVKVLETPTLILGYDADHPSAHAVRRHFNFFSHSALIGSRDLDGSRFCGIVQQQGVSEETMPTQHMCFGLKRHIIQFKKSTGKIPQRIIMYRDGIAESTLEPILDHEVKAMKLACKEININYNPEIVFIVCIKRHHMRFWPVEEGEDKNDNSNSSESSNSDTDSDSDNDKHKDKLKDKDNAKNTNQNIFSRNGNPLTGTIIDSTHVTRIKYPEFYLYSHESPIGTSRPLLYQILLNEPNLTMDEIQGLSYYLCHHTQRVARASATPAPLLHAHLLSAHASRFSGRFKENNYESEKWNNQLLDGGNDLWDKYVHPDLWEVPYYM